MTDKNVCPTDYGPRTTDFRRSRNGTTDFRRSRNGTTDFRRSRAGFTLAELSMALVIIAVMVALGWGVLYKIIDPASKESAQNQISAAINAARNRAMALQKTGGILFYIDPRSDRVTIANVVDTGPLGLDAGFINAVKNFGGQPPEVFLDLADTEFIPLPSGVTVQVLNNAVLVNGVAQNDQFIGFNQFQGPPEPSTNKPALSIPIGGAILFDGRGELVCRRWAMRFKYDPIGNGDLQNAAISPMLYLLFYDKAPDDAFFRSNALGWADALRVFFPNSGPNIQVLPLSTMGVAIMDREKFTSSASRFAGGSLDSQTDDQFRQGQTSLSPGERNEEQWIAANARVMMIGRYNGTLVDTRVK